MSAPTRFSKNFRNYGFTLVELLVAISIIAILSTIGLTVYTGIQVKARDTSRKAEILEIQKALEIHYTATREYPTSGGGQYGSGMILDTKGFYSNFETGFPPVDPSDEDPNNYLPGDYVYYKNFDCPGVGFKYMLCAKLEQNTGNRTALPGTGVNQGSCEPPQNTTSGEYFCVGSQSN